MGIFDETIPILVIILGIVGFFVISILIIGYKQKIPTILKILKVEYFQPKFILADGSYDAPIILSTEVSKKNGVFNHKGRSYLAPNRSQFHQDNRPVHLYHYDNPFPLVLTENQLVLKKMKEPPFDSKELHDSMETKVWETFMNLPTDMIKMLTLIVGIIAIIVSSYAIMQIMNTIEGLNYINDIIEAMAKDQNIDLPQIKPSIFGE